MANETQITKIVDPSAFNQLVELDEKIQKVHHSYVQAAIDMAKGLKTDPKSVSELIEKERQLKASLQELQNATKEANRLEEEKQRVRKRSVSAALEQIRAEKEAARIAKEQSRIDVDRSKTTLNLAQAKKNAAKAIEEESKANISAAKSVDNASKAEAIYARNAQLTGDEVEQLIAKLDSANLSYKEQAQILSQLKAHSKTQAGGIDFVDPKTLDTIQKLDKSLKEQDAKMGIYGRNVGNYASHWDGLGNAINQMTREMPAFAVSMNTGLLALSNNIPILADEIARIKRENKELTDSGGKAVPVWKKIAGSFLSWNTVLSVGVTLLTIYGSKIFDFAAAMLKGGEATVFASESLKKYNDLYKTAIEGYAGEIAKLELLYSASQNENKSKEDRILIIEELKKMYPDYLGKLSTEAILAGKASDAYALLNQNIKDLAVTKLIEEERAEAIKKVQKAIEDQSKAQEKLNYLMKLFDARTEAGLLSKSYEFGPSSFENIKNLIAERDNAQKLQEEIIKSNERYAQKYSDLISGKQFKESLVDLTALNEGYTNKLNELNKEVEFGTVTNKAYERRLKDIQKAYIEATEAAGIFTPELGRLKREVISYFNALTEEENKSDALATFDKNLAIQRRIEDSKLAVMMDGRKKERELLEIDYNRKIEDAKRNGGLELKLAESLQKEKESKLSLFDDETLQIRSKKELELNLALAQKGSLEEIDIKKKMLDFQKNEELKGLEDGSEAKVLVEQKYLNMVDDLYNEFNRKAFNRLQVQKEIELSEREIALNEELVMLDQQYTKGSIKKEAYEKKKSDLQYKYAVEALNNEIALLESNLDLFSGDERLDMERRIAQLRVQLSKETTDKIMSDGEKEKKNREDIEKAKIQLIQEASRAIGDIGNSIFQRRVQNIESEIDANQDQYDKQVKDIDSLAEKDVITKEEAEARKRVAEEQSARRNKELEKQKADLQTKQARFQKAMDIGQTISATALAVTKALPNYILAALVAATGAIQLATIIAQPIPKYAHGTDYHPGGLAVVGDGGKHEAIISNGVAYITPSKPTLLPIPRGAEVLPDINAPEFYQRYMDNSYWLTHNKAGEPISVNNNIDVDGIIKSNQKVEKGIQALTKVISKGQRSSDFELYKRSKMN